MPLIAAASCLISRLPRIVTRAAKSPPPILLAARAIALTGAPTTRPIRMPPPIPTTNDRPR